MGGIQQDEIVQQILGASELFFTLSLIYNLACLSYTVCFESSLLKFYPHPHPAKQPFKELCCLFFVQLGNRYIIVCARSLSVFAWERLCVYVLLSLRTSQVLRSVVLPLLQLFLML